MATAENPHAGQGPVVLDIGGDVGALVVIMPATMDGVEVEIVPTGTADPARGSHVHGHGVADDHEHDAGQLIHVAVVGRPLNDEIVHSLVYPELVEGSYDLYTRPDGPVRLTVNVVGGQVTEATW